MGCCYILRNFDCLSRGFGVWVGLVAICERNRGLGLGRQRVDPSLLWNTLAAARAQAHAKLIAFVIIRNLDDASSFLI